MYSSKIEFPGHSGPMLAARLDHPVTPPRACALFAHCFTCSKDIVAARRIAGRLASLGIAVVRFDFTGLGHSGGEFANTSFTSNIEDLVAAADWMRGEVGAPQLLIGHSLGGAAVIAAAPRIAETRAVAIIGAPHEPGHVLENFGSSLDTIRAHGIADVNLAGRTFKISKSFVDDVAAANLDETLKDLRRALLVMHAPLDQTVGIENASDIFVAAKHPKSFVSLDGADHLLTRAADADYAAGIIEAWARRYLDLAEPQTEEAAPEGVVRVSESDATGFLQDVSVNGKHIQADEPIAFGGTDLGLTPYQLVSAGLGACTSMTLRMYARHKGLALSHVKVDVSHDKVHAEDCAACETKVGKIDVFRRSIHISGDLDNTQRQRLLEMADRCPVHRTLESDVLIETEESHVREESSSVP